MRGKGWQSIGTAAAGAIALLTVACGAPRISLNTRASTCFRALPAAEEAVHGKGRLVGVRLVETGDLAHKVPEAAALGHRRLCGVAYRADYSAGEVTGVAADHGGRYAIVLVDQDQHVVAAFVVDGLPMRFTHKF